MALQDLQAELIGTVPKLPPLHALQLIQRSWGRIRDFRLWSFQVVADAQIWVPAVIVAGTVTTVNGSTTVTADGPATTAFNAVALGTPPLAGALGVGRQLRIGATGGLGSPTGPNYSILAWDGAGTLTIDKPYGEPSATRTNYQVLKCYYAAPGYPFTSPNSPDVNLIRYTSITNRLNGYSFRGKNLNWSQEMLNAIDPQRGGQGDSYLQANYSRATTGVPVMELYPNPVVQTTYNATYVTRWPDLSASQDLPAMPYALSDTVIHYAKVLAAQWATANVTTVSELGQTNWIAYANLMKEEFKESLQQCIKVDDELMPWGALRQGAGFEFPLGGQFLQMHDVSSLIPS